MLINSSNERKKERKKTNSLRKETSRECKAFIHLQSQSKVRFPKSCNTMPENPFERD